MIPSNVFMQADTLRKKWERGVGAKKLDLWGSCEIAQRVQILRSPALTPPPPLFYHVSARIKIITRGVSPPSRTY